MVQLILVIVSVVIILYINYTSKNNKRFDDILNKEYEINKNIILLDFKERTFIDKVIDDTKKLKLQQEQQYNDKPIQQINTYNQLKDDENNKKDLFINMLDKGYSEVEICEALNIGRGEFLLLKSLYKR